MVSKICLICKKEFVPYNSRQKCCSKLCSKIRHNQTIKIYNKNDKFKKYSKKYRKTHREEMLEYQKIYRDNHKSEIKEYYQLHKKELLEHKREYYKKYKPEIINKINKYSENKRKTDINYRLRRYLRTRIWFALKGIVKSESTMKLLGCNIEFFKSYYQSKFTKGMTWDKVMNGEIHCDHIKPCCTFDLTKPNEQRKCFNYKNLRPLWAEENLTRPKKGE